MTDSEAFVKARGGGNLIGKAMYGGGKITMKQLYLHSFEVVFDAYFKPGLVDRFFARKGQMGGNSQKICMIVEGTRCTASYHEQPLPLYEADLDPDMCQDSTFDKEKIIAQAKRVAMRIMRRWTLRIFCARFGLGLTSDKIAPAGYRLRHPLRGGPVGERDVYHIFAPQCQGQYSA